MEDVTLDINPTKEVIEGDMQIASFLGWVRVLENGYRLHRWYKKSKDGRRRKTFMGYDDSLEFSTDWNLLMNAWEAFRTIVWRNNKDSYPTEFYEHKDYWKTQCFNADIIKAHQVLVEAIQWNNTQHPQSKG